MGEAMESKADRINKLTEIVQKAVEGDHAVEIGTLVRDKELEPLAQAVRHLIDRLKEKTSVLEKTEETLRNALEKYRRLEATIPGMLYVFALHPDGTYSLPYVSPTCRDQFGLEPGEVMQNWYLIYNLVHPDDLARFDQSIKDSAESLQPWREVVRFVVKGETRWYDCMSRPRPPQPNGEIVWDGVVVDISERKQVEEEMAHSRAELKAIFDYAPLLMCLLDADRRVLYANRAFTVFTGVTEEDLVDGRACGVFGCINAHDDPRGCGFGPKCRDCRLRFAIEDTIKTGCSHRDVEYSATLERNNIRRDVVLLGSTALVPDENRREILLCLQDISERKLAERALRESEAKFRALVETTSTGYVIIDVMGKVLDANDEYVRMSGHTHRDEILGRSVLEWTAAYDRERNAKALEDCAREGFLKNLNIDYVGREGQIIPMEGNGTLIVTEAGEQIVTLCRDITEHKEREKKLHAYVQELRVLGALLMRFEERERKKLARELHDQVGQTLTALAMNLNLIQSQLPADTLAKVRERLGEALLQVEEMMDRIRNVMANLRPSVLDDYGLGAALRWLCHSHECRTGIVFEVNAPQSTSRSTPEVETAFFRIAQEALSNVSKYAQAHKVIIALDETAAGFSMSIADDGIGFDIGAEGGFRDRHWGLFTMRERARAVGANLRVESGLGRGTRVIVEGGR